MAFPSGMGWGRRSSPCPATLRVQRFNTKNGILRFTFRSAVMYLWACEGAFCETPLFRVLLKQTNKQTNGKHPHANIPILPLTTKPRSAPCCFYGRIHTSPPPAEQRPALCHHQRCVPMACSHRAAPRLVTDRSTWARSWLGLVGPFLTGFSAHVRPFPQHSCSSYLMML